MTLAVIVVLGLAAYRLTRALTVDTITDPFRAAVYDWAWEGPPDRPASKGVARGWTWELVSCSFCIGFWVSLAAVAVYATVAGSPPNIGAWVLDVFAVAGVQGLAAQADGRMGRG